MLWFVKAFITLFGWDIRLCICKGWDRDVKAIFTWLLLDFKCFGLRAEKRFLFSMFSSEWKVRMSRYRNATVTPAGVSREFSKMLVLMLKCPSLNTQTHKSHLCDRNIVSELCAVGGHQSNHSHHFAPSKTQIWTIKWFSCSCLFY